MAWVATAFFVTSLLAFATQAPFDLPFLPWVLLLPVVVFSVVAGLFVSTQFHLGGVRK